MAVYMLIFTINAEKNADCVSVLKKSSGGLDSPVLIYVGYAYVVVDLFAVVAGAFTLFFMCVKLCMH